MLRQVALVIQLTFEPAFDAYHGMYRTLRLRSTFDQLGGVPIDLARILDFYLLYPFRLSAIRLKREDLRIRTIGKRYDKTRPYSEMPDDRVIVHRMKPIQYAAYNTLAVGQLLEVGALEEECVKPTESDLPPRLADRIALANEDDADLIDALSVLATNYTLTGADGLKARSGLLEYRYD